MSKETDDHIEDGDNISGHKSDLEALRAPLPSAIEVSSAERLPIRPSIGPDLEYNRIIADSLQGTLEQLDINPDDVLVSGYDEEHQKPFVGGDAEWRAEIEEALLSDKELLAKAKERGFFSYPAEEADLEASIREAEAELASPKTKYYFSPFSALRSDDTNKNNPIDYAGKKGVLGVYDKIRLQELDPGLEVRGHDESWAVEATPEDIDSAKVLIFKPRYVDEAASSPNS